VALICNLVQEFNGLVSKGSTAMLAFLLFKKSPCFTPHFYRYFSAITSSKKELVQSFIYHNYHTTLHAVFVTSKIIHHSIITSFINFIAWLKLKQHSFVLIVDMKVQNGWVNVHHAEPGIHLLKK